MSENNPSMNKSARCDRCGAQAFVMASFTSLNLPLMFCGHHFAKHEDAIVLSGGNIVADERHTINLAPSMSASV